MEKNKEFELRSTAQRAIAAHEVAQRRFTRGAIGADEFIRIRRDVDDAENALAEHLNRYRRQGGAL